MRRFVFVLVGLLLAIGVLSVGCAQKEAAPAPVVPAQEVAAILEELKPPTEPGKDVVPVPTPQEQQVLPVYSQTGVAFDGKFGTLDQLEYLISTNQSYDFTIVEDVELGAMHVYIKGTGTGDSSGIIPEH